MLIGVVGAVMREKPSDTKGCISRSTTLKFHHLDVVSLSSINSRPLCGRSHDVILMFGKRVCGCRSLERRLGTTNRRFMSGASSRALVRKCRR